ncbi:glycosyltransferase family 2 protein [Candidatus Halobeggiatoa sp. HSG11]|nr:glycosyltransferase family 2 protein [Candidatus Halobeggiatoa sp. HSG11]
MQYSKLHQQTLSPFEKLLLKSERRAWQSKSSQFLNHIIAPAVFVSDKPLIELYHYGLTPVMNSVATVEQNMEVPVPILNGKIFQWHLNIKKPTTEILIKLGTGNRINHCQLLLEINDQDSLVATAKLDGTKVQDNQNNKFVLDKPLTANHYTCQLKSPDTDNGANTLFLWLEAKFENKQGLANYCYRLPADLPIPTKSTLITIIIQVEDHLQACLDSIIKQIYPHWELIINGEKSDNINYPATTKFIPKSADILKAITGEYVIIMPSNDLLTEDALLEVSEWLNDDVDMLYSDEDRFDTEDLFDEPYFKPDYSVEMQRSQSYTGQLGVYKTKLLQHLQDVASQFSGHHIQHIPKVLYHRRRQTVAIDYPLQTTQAILDSEAHGGIAKKINNNNIITYPITGQPLVSIIIPTKDKPDILSRCINSIHHITSYLNLEIIIVDNGSIEEETLQLFEKYKTNCKIFSCDTPFNFSKLVNYGVQKSQGEIILLLNNDTEVIGPVDWLQEMIGFAQHPEIAAVGCKLLYPQDNTVQHAGLICGIGGVVNHSHKHFPTESAGYFNRLAIVSNYSAITGACLMIKRNLWGAGFDENLSIAFNDVDFCLRLLHKGLRHVVLPQVTLYHHESQSRGLENTSAKQARLQQEEDYMRQRWGTILQNDPFYNPNLTKADEDFTISQDSIYYCHDYEKLLCD